MKLHLKASSTAHSDTASLRLNVVSGLTASAVVLPKAMAYATVAGLPVAVGLYTAFVPMLIYAFLGTSRVLSVSSSATLAILAGAQIGLAVPDGDPGKLITATATLTAMVGTMLLLARLIRLGFLANFISSPVLSGFKAGVGLVIVLDQVPKLLGIHIAKQGFFSRSPQHCASRTRELSDHDCGRCSGVPDPHRNGTRVATFASTTCCGGREYRRLVVLRPAGARRFDCRLDSSRVTPNHTARTHIG